MLDLIEIFRLREPRDELGIGVVRDAFADILFPGISTIQTRARYFLFIPWIYKMLEYKNISSTKFSRRARSEEINLIDVLAESSDNSGTIGVQARSNLKRLPSSIYWHGLGVWGIRLYPGSSSSYYRSLDSYYRSRRNGQHDGEEELSFKKRHNWHPGLPSPPEEFPQSASFRLAREEAEYLRERALSRCQGTMLALLLDLERDIESVALPWQHPDIESFPPHIREQLIHAQNFSEVIFGSSLLYNLMLAEKVDNDTGREWAEYYRDRLTMWAEEIEYRGDQLRQWDYEGRFWYVAFSRGTRMIPHTIVFINDWSRLALDPGVSVRIADSPDARALIRNRELRMKGRLARLDNQETLNLWTGAAGSSPLQYRWSNAKRIVTDILEELKDGR